MTTETLFRRMALIRVFEETALRLVAEGRIAGTVHTCIGQEANAVGVIGALDCDRDAVWSNHRGHGHFLAYTDDVHGLLAELLGLPSGVCGGRGGSQHLHSGRFYSNGIQGGIVPCAVGTAMALKDTGAISVVFLGDGTMGEGVVYEGLNLASLWDLPVLFVVEDNGIAQTTATKDSVAGSLRERAFPFGVKCHRAEITDPMHIAAIAAASVTYVRKLGLPAWLYLPSIRLGPHSRGDDTRSLEEVANLWTRDPLDQLRPSVPDHAAIMTACRNRVQEALACVLSKA